MIRFESVFKRYAGGREALAGVDLSMETGEMAFLTGRSGAGKSTLLKLIGLLERPTRGQVIVDGRNTRGIRRRQIPAYRRQIGMVFQDHKLLHDRSTRSVSCTRRRSVPSCSPRASSSGWASPGPSFPSRRC